MAGPRRLKLGGLEEGMVEIAVAKEFFGSVRYLEIANFRCMEFVVAVLVVSPRSRGDPREITLTAVGRTAVNTALCRVVCLNSTMSQTWQIRPAEREDCKEILRLIIVRRHAVFCQNTV